jgi:tripartite-type tricarboxylate transporter receptor subunit TctC
MTFKKFLLAILFTPLVGYAWEPNKPIEIYTPFSAGNAMEISARIVSKQVEKNTNARFVIINKPGAGGSIVNDYIFKQRFNPYVSLSGSVPGIAATDKITMPNKQFSAKDFTYVLNMVSIPMTIISNPNDPVNSINEYAKVVTNEKVTQGDPGAAARLFYELLQQHINFIEDNSHLVRADYKGPADVLSAVMAGHVRFGIVPLSVSHQAHLAGKIKIIGVSSAQQIKTIPTVQTFTSVYPGVIFNLDIPLVLPPETSAGVLEWYNKEFKKALQSKEVQESLALNMMYVNTKLLDSKEVTKYIMGFEKQYDPVIIKVLTTQKGN